MTPMRRLRLGVDTLYVVVIAVGIGALLWWWVRPQRRDSPSIATCVAYYADARTAAETLRVNDAAIKSWRGDPAPMTCGNLRSVYPEQFAPKPPPN